MSTWAVLEGQLEGRNEVHELVKEEVFIGRDPTISTEKSPASSSMQTIRVFNASVSKTHCRITFDGSRQFQFDNAVFRRIL